MQQRVIKYFLDNDSSEREHALKFMLNFHGVSSVRTNDINCADIIYDSNPVNAKLNIIINDFHIIWHDLVNNKISAYDIEYTINFDIVNAISLLLNDVVNKGLSDNAFDKHGRLRFERSWQSQNSLDKLPLVNLYCSFFSNVIELLFKIERKEFIHSGRRAMILLSHDVDRVYKYQVIKNFRMNPLWNFKEKVYHFAMYLHNKRKELINKDQESYFIFDKIIDFESSLGVKSTFFFCANSGYSEWGSGLDVFYDINWNEFKEAFNIIKQAGFEIALQASYNCYNDLERFVSEKKKLENVSGSEINGIRHHYWHTGKDIIKTLSLHNKAGFRYDSSVAFNEHIGFRFNTALPFHPFDCDSNSEMELMEFPILSMDGNFFYKENITLDEVLITFSEYLKILKRYNGVCSIDWHSEASYPSNSRFRKWAEGYTEIIKLLVSDHELQVTNHMDAYEHFSKREKEILSV